MASISFASESLMDPRIQVKLDKYQKCGNIISQTSLLSSYTGSETDIRVGVIKIVIVINCNLITFSKVIAFNCNSEISLITVIECN